MPERPERPDGPVAVVLAGGGGRGAYEVGALSVLLPELDALGQRPSIVVGTSAGALNGAWLAAHADRPAGDPLTEARGIWSQLAFGDVVRPLVSVSSSARVARWLAGGPLGALLDPAPLRSTLPRLIPFARLRANADAGRVVLAVATTVSHTGRTAMFVDGADRLPEADEVRGIDYVRARIGVQHLMASAAIPAAFPAVRIGDHHFVDGGTRMNTPIKPALELGARRVVVIGLNGTAPDDREPHRPDRPPDAMEGIAHVVQGLLADPLAADVRTLAGVNERPGTPPERQVPYILVAPPRRDAIGEVARRVYVEHFRALRPWGHDRDVRLLGRLIGADRSDMHGELFSYLCFAGELAAALIERGEADAQAWLRAPHDEGLWQLGRPVAPPA